MSMVMEAGASLLSCSYSSLSPSSSLSSFHHSSKTHFKFVSHNSHRLSPPPRALWKCLSFTRSFAFDFGTQTKNCLLVAVPSNGCSSRLQTSAFVVEKAFDNSSHSAKDKEMMPKIDKTGRFCSPRAARELALMILYAACLEGSDPIRLFEKRMNARREPGYEFDKASLSEYNHMSFGGPPVITETVEEADELLQADEKESAIEAEVLSAPPKLVYSRLLLRFTRKLLVAVADRWDSHALFIEKAAPANWKKMPAGRILELCILHLAMSEIKVLGTQHQIVINEAVDLTKRFCDGAAPRIVNGCLRNFMKDVSRSSEHQEASDGNEKADA